MTSAEEVTLTRWPLAPARRLVAGRPQRRADTRSWHPDYPLPEGVDVLAMALGAHQVDRPLTALPAWWVHQIRYRGEVVGDAGFHGPPAGDGPVEVEIGYAVVPALRGRGIGTRACRLLLNLAWAAGAETVLADAAAGNLASRTVLRRCGFVARPAGGLAVHRRSVVQEQPA